MAGEEWKRAADAAMARYAQGDAAAFAEVYDALAPRLYAFVARRVRDAARAEDVVQQTFLQMHRARAHFTPGAPVMPWAFAIARRLLIDGLRRRESSLAVGGAEADDLAAVAAAADAAPDEVVGRRRLARRIEAELRQVPGPMRVAFELVHGDGLTASEAAQVLGTTVMAVKMRVHRTCKLLRITLGEAAREELVEAP
jgi:RNA polymerase sigma-70 factor (ECF subfamily)